MVRVEEEGMYRGLTQRDMVLGVLGRIQVMLEWEKMLCGDTKVGKGYTEGA